MNRARLAAQALLIAAGCSCEQRAAQRGPTDGSPDAAIARSDGTSDAGAADTEIDAVDPCSGVVCDDPGPCEEPAGACAGGICTYLPLPDGTACDDQDPCTFGDACAAGVCGGSDATTESIAILVDNVLFSLTADAAGTAHVFYVEQGELTHASRPAAGGWYLDLGLAHAADSHMLAAAAGPGGTLHVAFHDWTGLAYARFDGIWTFETIDPEPPVPDWTSVGWFPSVAVGADGVVHVAYGRYLGGYLGLVHAWRETDGTWTTEVVDPDWGAGVEPAVVVDDGGTVHIVYWRASDDSLLYAQRPPVGVWSIETVANAAGLASGPALAVDAAGRPHVAFERRTRDNVLDNGRNLRYGRKDAGRWSFESIDDDGGEAPSLALDANGLVHVAYLADHGGYHGAIVRRAHRGTDGRWRIQTLESSPAQSPWSPSIVGETALAIGGDVIHVVYDWSEGGPNNVDLRDAIAPVECDGACAGLSCGAAASACHAPQACVDGLCLDIASEGAACDSGDACLPGVCLDATCTGRRDFRTEVADPEGNWLPSVAVDSAGVLHVASQDWMHESLRYAYLAPGGSWMAETVETEVLPWCGRGGTGHGPSIDVGTDGAVHISYARNLFDCGMFQQSAEIRYATRSTPGPWTVEIVDPAANGLETALAVASDDTTVHVLYAGACPTDGLCHAENSGGAFVADLVHGGPNLFSSPALAIDSGGDVHAGYLVGAVEVRYARFPSGGAWTTSMVSGRSVVEVTRQVSLALDSSGEPHVGFVSWGCVAEAHGDGAGGWTTTELFGSCYSDHPSIVLDGAGAHHMAALQGAYEGGTRLRYASQPPTSTWTIEDTMERCTGQQGTALALDPAGGVHLFFGRLGLLHVWFPGCP